MPCAVARSDARPPDMWTVAGSILTSSNILSWRLASYQLLAKECALSSLLVNCLGGLPRNSVDWPDSVFTAHPSVFHMPCAVARSDARPPDMWTVAGSILTSSNILSWRLASYQLLAKECALSSLLVNCLGGLPRNSVDRFTDRARNYLKEVEGP